MDERVPTLSDVAARAGVSYATADRVVNGRGNASERATRRVREAIEALGYRRNVAAANLSQRRFYRFAIVLPEGSNAFFKRMRALFQTAATRLLADRVRLDLAEVTAFDPAALRACLAGLTEKDGIALVGSDDPATAAAVDDLRAAGMPVLTLVSDIPGTTHDGYIGIDNRVAGRMAARLLTLAHTGRSGRILPVAGALSARDHADRLKGLAETIAPPLTLAPVVEGRDEDALVAARVADALAADPAITAIYSAGAGTPGLIRALSDRAPVERALSDRATDRPRPVTIVHELTPDAHRALASGCVDIVIDQRPEEAVARVIERLRQVADRQPPELSQAPAPIMPTLYMRENLPPLSIDTIQGRSDP